MLYPLDIPRGRDTISNCVSLTSVTIDGTPIDDLTRLIGAPASTWIQMERILSVVPQMVSVGFCDGKVIDFISKNREKA